MWITLGAITIFSCVLAGMGIGGGSIFILLTTIFGLFSHKQAQGFNLILFIVIGITATFKNVKDKKFDLKIFLKLLIPMIIGSLIGMFFMNKVEENTLKVYFNIFMCVIGAYEIISSLISIKNAKNNSMKGSE